MSLFLKHTEIHIPSKCPFLPIVTKKEKSNLSSFIGWAVGTCLLVGGLVQKCVFVCVECVCVGGGRAKDLSIVLILEKHVTVARSIYFIMGFHNRGQIFHSNTFVST